MDELRAWARQPTTVAGFSALIATIIAVIMKQVTWVQAVPLLVGSAMSMVLPDNTSARLEAQQLAGAVVLKITSEKETA